MPSSSFLSRELHTLREEISGFRRWTPASIRVLLEVTLNHGEAARGGAEKDTAVDDDNYRLVKRFKLVFGYYRNYNLARNRFCDSYRQTSEAFLLLARTHAIKIIKLPTLLKIFSLPIIF